MLASNLNWSWTMVSLIHKSLINQLCLVGQVNLSWLTNFSDFITYLVSTWGYWKWSQLLSTEFPKSLVSDSKSRVSRSKTRIGLELGLDIKGSTRLRLGIGIVVMTPVAVPFESVLYFRDFIGENRVSDSKYRVSRLWTRNRTRNRSRC